MIEQSFHSYTLEDCLLAKKKLVQLGKKESDFYLNKNQDQDYLNNEPMILTNNGDRISARELINQIYINQYF